MPVRWKINWNEVLAAWYRRGPGVSKGDICRQFGVCYANFNRMLAKSGTATAEQVPPVSPVCGFVSGEPIIPASPEETRRIVSIPTSLVCLLLWSGSQSVAESLDLPTLAKRPRPAVMLLVVSDSSGKEVARGTAFFVSSDGKLVTSKHVLKGGASSVARAESGAFFKVEGTVAADERNDIALLQAEVKGVDFLSLADKEAITVGQQMAVVGSPLGLEGTLSEGIVSAIRETEGTSRLLQITAAISPGSSGSPVLNLEGKVVGVAAMLVKGGQSLNFAIPADAVRALMRAHNAKPIGQPPPLGTEELPLDEYRAFISEVRNAYRLLAKIERATGLQAARALADKYPNRRESFEVRAVAYEIAGMSDASLRVSKRCLERYPESSELWQNLGAAYESKKDYELAIDAYRRAIKINPTAPLLWTNLGGALIEVGREFEALEACREALKLDPDESAAYLKLARIHGRIGNEKGVREALENAAAASGRRAEREKK